MIFERIGKSVILAVILFLLGCNIYATYDYYFKVRPVVKYWTDTIGTAKDEKGNTIEINRLNFNEQALQEKLKAQGLIK